MYSDQCHTLTQESRPPQAVRLSFAHYIAICYASFTFGFFGARAHQLTRLSALGTEVVPQIVLSAPNVAAPLSAAQPISAEVTRHVDVFNPVVVQDGQHTHFLKV